MKSVMIEKSVPVELLFLETVGGTRLEPKQYDISFTVRATIEGTTELDLLKAYQQQQISYAKVTAFFEGVVHQSIVYDSLSKNTMENFHDFINNLILLPELNEIVFCAALHAKLNSIVQETSTVERIKIVDKVHGLTYDYFLMEEIDYDELPMPDDWSNEFSCWPGCWWFRNDITTYDTNLSTQEELDVWNKAKVSERLEEENYALFKAIEEQFYDMLTGEKETLAGEIIEVDFKKWNPKIIE